MRTVKTASGARAVQIVHSSHRGSRDLEHIGSAGDDVHLKVLKAAARQRLTAGQGELDLGLEPTNPAKRAPGGGALPITSSRTGHLWDALSHDYGDLGFGRAADGDEVSASWCWPGSSSRSASWTACVLLEEAGVAAASYRTPSSPTARVCEAVARRQDLAAACAAHVGLGPASLVLYDVSTLYFETDAGDGFRKSGFSKERCLDPQIHHRPAHRSGGVPGDGQRVRGQHRGHQDDAAGDRGVHGCPQAARSHRGS